jgi:hypothetical protein
LFGQPEPEVIEKGTFISLLLSNLFNEILRETNTVTTRSLEIAVKMGVMDLVKVRPARNPYDKDGSTNLKDGDKEE